MSETKLGQLIAGYEQRDAVHVAIVPVTANEDLRPGQDIGFVWDSIELVGSNSPNLIGIVDPFLKTNVREEERFFMLLYPNTVIGMRHHWSHPAFREHDRAASEAWLRAFIQLSDCPDYDTVLKAATGQRVEDIEDYGRAYELTSEYLYFAGRDAHAEIPPEFWDHVENVTGRKCWTRPRKFSCSC